MGKLADMTGVTDVPYKILASAGYICVPKKTFIDGLKSGAKKLSDLAATDLMKLAKFAEGTFSSSGDAAETTILKHSDGSSYYTIVTEGTLAYDGEIPNFSEVAIEYLFGDNYKKVSIDATGKATVGSDVEDTASFSGGVFKSLDLHVISGFSKVEGVPLFIETTQGDFDFMLFPNATITASQAGSLDSDGTATWALNITASTYVPKEGENANIRGSVMYGDYTA